MFAVYVIALFCLTAVSHSEDPACKVSVEPLDHLDPHQLEGKWNLVAGSLTEAEHVEDFKKRQSASIIFENSTDPSTVHVTRMFRFPSGCQYMHLNVTLQGSSFVFGPLNLTFLHTSCEDCGVVRFTTQDHKIQRVYLFSKKSEVEQKELEEFKAQLECLHMPPPIMVDPTKELCPDESATATTSSS